MEIFKAHAQWSNRPKDERFLTLLAMHDACTAYRNSSGTKLVPYNDIRVEAVNDEVQLVGRMGIPAQLTHYSFGQLSARVGAPAEYLRNLPPTLAAQNLNHGLANRAKDNDEALILFHRNSGLLARAFTSDKYTRVWNSDITSRLLRIEQDFGWNPARSTFNIIDPENPPALYASDHDMFAFLMRQDRTITEPGMLHPLYRGVIVENSEVGDSALKMSRFLFREVCGNHIIWGVQQVTDISIRHVGNADERWGQYAAQLRRYADGAASLEEAQIASAKTKMLGGTRDEVLDKLFGLRSLRLSRKMVEAGYDAVNPDEDGDPRTVWGMVNGLTRYSQTLDAFADKRVEVDRAAGRLMEIVF